MDFVSPPRFVNCSGVSQRSWRRMSIRTLRFADGPDEVHRNAIAKMELARYSK